MSIRLKFAHPFCGNEQGIVFGLSVMILAICLCWSELPLHLYWMKTVNEDLQGNSWKRGRTIGNLGKLTRPVIVSPFQWWTTVALTFSVSVDRFQMHESPRGVRPPLRSFVTHEIPISLKSNNQLTFSLWNSLRLRQFHQHPDCDFFCRAVGCSLKLLWAILYQEILLLWRLLRGSQFWGLLPRALFDVQSESPRLHMPGWWPRPAAEANNSKPLSEGDLYPICVQDQRWVAIQ
jgi:hypothetical protein